MFDIGFFELVLLGVVGLLVLGPERLPHAIRMGSAYMGKIRRAVMNVREEFEREVNLQEIQQRIKQQVDESGVKDAKRSLEDLKASVEGKTILPQQIIQPAPKATDNSGPEETPTTQPDPDTAHNPTLPENEAEPLPEATKINPEKESPKA